MKLPPVRVLLVEDNEHDVRLLRELLRNEHGPSVHITQIDRMSNIASHLAAGETDVVLLDLGLPDAQGPEAVRQAHAVAPTVPIVIMTGLDDESLATQVLKEGAQDYLVKGQLDAAGLMRAIRHAIRRQRTQVEADVIRGLQLQLRDEFLSDVSHELRSPLTAIYQFVTILADDLSGPTTPAQQEHLDIILRNVEQLRGMIDDILDAGRAEGGRLSVAPECTSLADVIGYTATTLQGAARDKHITLSFDVPSDLPTAYADPKRLRQVLIILLDNAIKFTPANGVVMIRTCVHPIDPRMLLVEVEDSGCGIALDSTEKIFDRLYRVASTSDEGRRGLGLGLFICRELVTQQGGRIWVTSDPGKGSVFSFTLPRFSLTRMITPMLQGSHTPVALVSVAIDSERGTVVDETWQHWTRETRAAVRSCLSVDAELLLPEMGAAQRNECAFVLTTAVDGEMDALSARIRSELDGLDPLRKAGLSCSVSASVLDLGEAADGASNDERIESVSQRITERIAVGIQRSRPS
ncbi:MAG TPA: ATP-binding protein [Candidatus Saccharimonadaceae bacterium]|nr:ATP-binding protein [Candidatus Saccharimonadaceae bacterium]